MEQKSVEQDNTNPKGRTIKIDLIIFGLLFLGIPLLGVLTLFCEYYPFSQGPPTPSSRDLLFLSIFLSIPAMYGSMCAPLIPVMLIACLFVKKVWRVRLILITVLSFMCLSIQVGLYHIMPYFKHNAYRTIVSRGQVLIDAISSYQQDYYSYPENLEILVPAYIDKIPETGIRGFPCFEYEILNPAEYKYPAPEMGDKPIYELRVKLERIFKWDRVFYWPVEEYPALIYGGSTEKIGKWVYVDE